MTYDSVFEVREGTTIVEKTLGEILGESGTTSTYHLTNHLTGREFRFINRQSINMRRNYAFYIMDGAWQEAQLMLSTIIIRWRNNGAKVTVIFYPKISQGEYLPMCFSKPPLWFAFFLLLWTLLFYY